ncbi:transcriptional regulator [Sphaerisporangium siamense]|uniref:DNA-binding transcriptional LysR family regulator n=1 Tax=Sphaerisporangium siamense TaxID=795645 RepID=A0A7W7DEJ6_9ACTN|nr:LysR family transcriptional regulator [Sphaerisporangium siamense]MBB4705420.1 DNA-binding transcriptional LysR family regulator [Sphaerisporangium siamense]GII86428.1 transcriptional regulator [Sphaerisporangium siamense]
MDLEIRHLRMICALAETGSVTRAAARLGLSQPAITSRLHHLENLVGATLFVRSRSGVEPTPLGSQVVARARIVLAEVDALLGDLRVPRGPDGVLRLGSVHVACVASIVGRVSEALPGREVSLRIEPSAALLAEALSRGHLDAALIGVIEGFDITLVAPVVSRTLVPRYPIFVALSAAHPLAAQEEISLADLREEAWISPPGADDGSLAALRASCRAAGYEPRVLYDAPSGAARPLVAEGHGVRLVDPSWPVPSGVSVRPLAGEPQVARLVVAWRRDRLSAACASALYRGLADAYGDHVDGNPAFSRWWRTHPEVHPLT